MRWHTARENPLFSSFTWYHKLHGIQTDHREDYLIAAQRSCGNKDKGGGVILVPKDFVMAAGERESSKFPHSRWIPQQITPTLPGVMDFAFRPAPGRRLSGKSSNTCDIDRQWVGRTAYIDILLKITHSPVCDILSPVQAHNTYGWQASPDT